MRAITGASDAGCRARDFAALRDGEVALVQRGTCRMSVKAHNAQAAGASAVLIVNDGRPGNRGAIAGTLGAPGLRIPAVFLSTAAGRDVRAAGRVTVDVDAVSEERRTANVLAETGRGSRVAMAGAHLDSVTDGPGINDDGSGVAALLAAAGTLRGRAPDGARLRLGFWGAEELGLYGSRRYVAGLGEAARKAIAGYVNLDMVGTRDGDVAVYRGDDGIRRSLRRALTERGVDDIQGEDLGASSDHAPFAAGRDPGRRDLHRPGPLLPPCVRRRRQRGPGPRRGRRGGHRGDAAGPHVPLSVRRWMATASWRADGVDVTAQRSPASPSSSPAPVRPGSAIQT